jgi:5-methylcytosine-specific restriction endonuclease McrA
MRKYREYKDSDVILFSKEVLSIAGLLRKLNLKPAGGNYSNIKRILQKLNVDTSHWTGYAWNKGQRLKDWSKYTKASNLKSHLIKKRGNQCELCKTSKWLNKDIKLELHHKNGDRTDNNIDNLTLLCPNCHSQTDTWRKWK